MHGVSAHSEYTITALVTGSHGHSLLMLQAGSAVNDFVEKDQFSYYRFTLSQSHKDLTFVVTPFSGDPDIYVSTTYPYPNRTHYTWSHRSRGRDAVTITESDPRACHTQFHETGTCDYFIAVHGYGAVATYTIMAYLHDNTPKILQRGIPQSGHANQTESQYYQFTITDKKENIVLTLTPEDEAIQISMSFLGLSRKVEIKSVKPIIILSLPTGRSRKPLQLPIITKFAKNTVTRLWT